jgi:hypothetical protein
MDKKKPLGFLKQRSYLIKNLQFFEKFAGYDDD